MAASGRDFQTQNMDSGDDIKGELQFQDIDHTTIDLDDEQTHKFSNFPPAQNDDSDEENTGDSDKLLKSEKKANNSFWTFEYYQQFFDVDTQQVGTRVLWSMIPHPKRNFLQHYIQPNPDLYGPFWVCTTLVFMIAIGGNIANYIGTQGGDEYEWQYDFHKVTLSATTIYSYWWLVPAAIWGVLMWRGNKTGVTFLEILCLYGYSLSIYIPISLLWVIQVTWLQWILVLVGFAMSGAVIVFTLWPTVSEDDKKISISVMAVIIILHGLLAVGFMLYFFHVPAISEIPATSSLAPSTVAPAHDVTKIQSKHS